MSFLSPIRPLLKGWLISFLVFGLLAFVFVGGFARMVSMPLGPALWIGARDWLPWAVLTPLFFRLASRIPLERFQWKKSLAIHLACALATMAFCAWWADMTMSIHTTRGAPYPEFHEPHPSSFADSKRPPSSDHPPFGARPGLFFILAITLGMRFPIYVTLLSVAHALHFYRRSQERERRALELAASLAQSRLEALKMQLQPHFLFNTLNAIAELVHRNAEAADEMLAALSDLLRLTLETASEQELPLRRELQFVERYLAIERVRFGDRLRFELDVAPAAQDALVPTFLLQPLVENAIRHGLEPQSSSGLLTIRAARDGAVLRLRISDNGRGLPKDRPMREGIGISNSRARLSALYGESASFILSGAAGLDVDIVLPFHLAS